MPGKMRAAGSVLLCALFISACASSPKPVPDPVDLDARKAQIPPTLSQTDVAFDALPGWSDTDPRPAIEAFARSCEARNTFQKRNDVAAICASVPATLADTPPEQARAWVATYFHPVLLTTDERETGTLTSYFEPVYEARRVPEGAFTAPLRLPPPDLPRDVERTGYATRAQIERRPPNAVVGWVQWQDKVFLQIQGSGRLVYPDGTIERAAFAATNGQPFRSIATELVRRGELQSGKASNAAIDAWIRLSDYGRMRDVVDANPRYVFFRSLPLGDASLGPVGAAGVPLTAEASMAVDPEFAPMGLPVFIAPEGNGAPVPRLVIAQDTGGAIKGPMRGDLFMGTGVEAGDRAARVKFPARWYALVPVTNPSGAGGAPVSFEDHSPDGRYGAR